MNDDVTTMRTDYGFKFGAALVERCASFPGGRVVVTVTTPKCALQVYVTKTGKMRVYFGGMEVLLTKRCLDSSITSKPVVT